MRAEAIRGRRGIFDFPLDKVVDVVTPVVLNFLSHNAGESRPTAAHPRIKSGLRFRPQASRATRFKPCFYFSLPLRAECLTDKRDGEVLP